VADHPGGTDVMTTYVYIATSLDGYIAEADGGLDWLNAISPPAGCDYGYAAFMAGIDALVMGRKTFEVVMGFGEWSYTKPVIVLSRSLSELPPEMSGKAELLAGSPVEILNALERRGFEHLYLDGGQTVQAFLREDLVDELIVTRIPILLGKGIPLFGDMPVALSFNHSGTETFENGLTQSRYVRDRSVQEEEV
jgi:dihydrofolate reductase